jgi:hypothetical protein
MQAWKIGAPQPRSGPARNRRPAPTLRPGAAAKENRANDRMRKLLNINRLNENKDRRQVARSCEAEIGMKQGDWGRAGPKKNY